MQKPYAQWTREQKQRYMKRCYVRRLQRKQKLVELHGGRCARCGYNRCMRAMSFHHRNPKEKAFSLDNRFLAAKPWKALVAEAAKCDLLCLELSHGGGARRRGRLT